MREALIYYNRLNREESELQSIDLLHSLGNRNLSGILGQ